MTDKFFSSLVAVTLSFSPICLAKELSWTPEKIMELKSIKDVQISPDNSHSLFVSTTASIDKDINRSVSQIHLTKNVENSSALVLTSQNFSSSQPRWSPDGSLIAYISENEKGEKGLYLMYSDGSDKICIHSSKFDIQNFKWSPDSTQLAFVQATEHSNSDDRGFVIVDETPLINTLWLVKKKICQILQLH